MTSLPPDQDPGLRFGAKDEQALRLLIGAG
jgi:hypothetical protein